jgi:hypothetical protein
LPGVSAGATLWPKERPPVPKKTFTLADCPTPYPPWMAGATLPEIVLTIPLESTEDLTGATIEMILVRPTTILEKVLIEVENVAGSHATFKVEWASGDLVEGTGQRATFNLTTAGGDLELVGRFNIDVIANLDPTP